MRARSQTVGKLLSSKVKGRPNSRTYMTETNFPDVLKEKFRKDQQNYADLLNKHKVDLSNGRPAADKALRVAGNNLCQLIDTHKNDPEVRKLSDLISEYNKTGSDLNTLVIKGVPFDLSNPRSVHLASLALGQQLGGGSLSVTSKDNPLERLHWRTPAITDVVGTHDRLNPQWPRTDRIFSGKDAPTLVTLFTKANEQQVPTYFIDVKKAIWPKLSPQDQKNLSNEENFRSTWTDGTNSYSTKPHAILSIEGDIRNPRLIQACFDQDSKTSSYSIESRNKDAQKSFKKVQEIVGELAESYHNRQNVPENNNETWEHNGKPGDLTAFKNGEVLHARPPITDTFPKNPRTFVRTHFNRKNDISNSIAGRGRAHSV